jgi:hypothetical protein
LESEKRSDSPRDTISLKQCRTSRPASTFGQEQAAALVTVAPKQKRSLNPNCKVKEQVSSNTIVRAAYMIKHRDIGFGKPSAPIDQPAWERRPARPSQEPKCHYGGLPKPGWQIDRGRHISVRKTPE